jgi:hypothetical protein
VQIMNKHVTSTASLIACAVSAVLIAANAHAAQSSSLSVRNQGPASVPQVRSVQRDTADNERISAAASETVELLLADGTSITLAPGASLVLERYRYDRASHAGELKLRVESGAVRTVGGTLNNSSEILLMVPGGNVAIDNAVAFVQVGKDASEISLIAGRKVAIKGSRETRTLVKAGTSFSLASSGAFVGATRKLSVSDMQRLASMLNPGLVSGVVPHFVVDARSVDTSGETADEATSQARADASDVAETGVAEDGTAKDVKLAPELPAPIAPTGACVAATCVAGAPNFDLNSSVGVVGGRQYGLTLGATWQREYSATDPAAGFGIINTPASDFWPDGGYRNTTARIFASAAATPYSLTLDPATPPRTVVDTGFTCYAGNGDDCHSVPIIDLYYSLNQSTSGLSYRFAGFNLGDLAEVMQLDFSTVGVTDYSMSDGEFGVYGQILDVPIDFNAPGILQTQSVDRTTFGCLEANGDPCTEFFGSDPADKTARDAALANPGFLEDYTPEGPSSLFSEVYTVLTPHDDDGFGNPQYTIDVSFSGSSHYDVSSIQTGFHRITITNFQSDFRRVCDLHLSDTGPCKDLALALFGYELGSFTDVDFNYDIDPDGNVIELPGAGTVTASLAVRDDDSFLVVDATSRMPGDNQRLFYAQGSVSGDLGAGTPAQGATLDRFHLSPGLSQTAALGRAFLRPDTLLGIAPAALLSSDLLVLNAPYTATVPSGSRAFHYDFAAAGDGAAQSSTISVTLGSIAYNAATNDTQLAGRTVGSTARAGTSRYSGSVESALFSTAAGGGNPNIAGTGRAGYFVLENYDPVSAPTGGTERTIENATASTTNYALLRFGQVLAGASAAAPARTSSTGLTGYVGGIAEVTSTAGSATTIGLQELTANNLQLATNAIAGSVTASFTTQLGSSGTAATTVTLGGANRLSAYTGVKEYAAMTAGVPNIASAITDAGAPNAAIVSGAPLVASATQGWTADMTETTRGQLGAGTAGYRHLQWGFFFGDVAIGSGQQAHAHLTSWVAGTAAAPNAPLPTGSADYTGHVFANVSNGDQLYTAAGSFANHWDFANRTGTGTMSFDDATYSLTTRMAGLRRDAGVLTSDSTTRFEGLISAEGSRDYIGALSGGFAAAGGASATDGLAQRAAVMGQFSLGTTRGGNDYRAVGTFGAERTTGP